MCSQVGGCRSYMKLPHLHPTGSQKKHMDITAVSLMQYLCHGNICHIHPWSPKPPGVPWGNRMSYNIYIYICITHIYIYMYVHIYITAWWFRPILHWLQIIIQPSFTEPHGRLVGAPTSKLRRWQHWDQLLENVDRVASNSMQNKGVKMLNLYFKIGNLWWPVFVQVCVKKKKTHSSWQNHGPALPQHPLMAPILNRPYIIHGTPYGEPNQSTPLIWDCTGTPPIRRVYHVL